MYGTVFVFDVNLAQECLPIGVDLVFACIGVGTNCPAAGHCGDDQIVLAQRVRYIEGLVLDLMFVRCEARGKVSVPEPLAIELQFVDSQRGGLDPRAAHCGARGETMPKDERNGGKLAGRDVVAICDPVRGPRLVQPSRPKGRGGGGDVASCGRGRDVDRIGGPGLHRTVVDDAGLARDSFLPCPDAHDGVAERSARGIGFERKTEGWSFICDEPLVEPVD